MILKLMLMQMISQGSINTVFVTIYLVYKDS